MENGEFQLITGVEVELDAGVTSAYTEYDGGFEAVVSAEKIPQLVNSFTALLDEPVFFFLELPKNADENDNGYDVYYLDNCTIPVAKAIMKRYGELLVQDGISRFGFGSHSSDEEIYVQDYQQVSIYCPAKKKVKALLADLDIKKTDKLKTMWEGFSEDTPGISIRVELNGETVFDIPENLKGEGMYKAR